VIGPAETDEKFIPVEELFRTPRHEGERENTLAQGQLLTHVLLPPPTAWPNATYEFRHGAGPTSRWPPRLPRCESAADRG
jgi:CO/xanthine dehydrogenase FAD-binding subunit